MIIGLIGNKRVGKDTVADYICEKFQFKKYAFADGVKDTCKVLFNFTDDQLKLIKRFLPAYSYSGKKCFINI